MIIRLSQKLAKKIKAGPLETLPLDENPYADWSAHLFNVGRTQYIILSNTKSLYSCVMYSKGITNADRFIERAMNAIREFMQDDGHLLAYEQFIAPSSGTVQFAKALNRSVTGSMNDHIQASKLLLSDGDMSSHDVGTRLNGTPLSALTDAAGRKYAMPREVIQMLSDSDEWGLEHSKKETPTPTPTHAEGRLQKVTICSVKRNQFNAWLNLRKAVYTGMRDADHRKEMEVFLAAGDKDCLLACTVSGEICGMLEVTLRNIVDGCLTSPVGYIEGIFVSEGYRGQGIARQLTEHAEQWCRSKGCHEIATDSEWDNHDAQCYHEHMGFEETYRIVEYRKQI